MFEGPWSLFVRREWHQAPAGALPLQIGVLGLGLTPRSRFMRMLTVATKKWDGKRGSQVERARIVLVALKEVLAHGDR